MKAIVIGLLLLGPGGCASLPADPVQADAVAALGPEDGVTPPGPNHRSGQPCLVCHSDAGGKHVFSVAGTVYRRQDTMDVFGGAKVLLLDSAGHTATVTTNCAGNFYLTPDQFLPTYPLWTTVSFGMVSIDMESMVHRDGSCAGCHADPASQTSAGHVFLTDDPLVTIPPSTPCPRGAR